jgi:hypothetical protein
MALKLYGVNIEDTPVAQIAETNEDSKEGKSLYCFPTG